MFCVYVARAEPARKGVMTGKTPLRAALVNFTLNYSHENVIDIFTYYLLTHVFQNQKVISLKALYAALARNGSAGVGRVGED